jgi:hypothetical protein
MKIKRDFIAEYLRGQIGHVPFELWELFDVPLFSEGLG